MAIAATILPIRMLPMQLIDILKYFNNKIGLHFTLAIQFNDDTILLGSFVLFSLLPFKIGFIFFEKKFL